MLICKQYEIYLMYLPEYIQTNDWWNRKMAGNYHSPAIICGPKFKHESCIIGSWIVVLCIVKQDKIYEKWSERKEIIL